MSSVPSGDAGLLAPSAAPDFSMAGDSFLADALLRGEREALAEIYERHSAAVYDIAHALGGEGLATSVVQQTFLELWLAPDEFAPGETLRAHLSRRAHLAAVSALPKETGGDRRSRETADHAWPLLSLLPGEERSAIWMTYFVGYSARELAQRLHLPERIIRQRITDGLRRLRSIRDAAAC